MFNLKLILTAVTAAVDAKITGAEVGIPTFNDEALAFLENTVAPAFDIPATIVALVKVGAPAAEAVLEPIELNGLKFLKLRVDALLAAA